MPNETLSGEELIKKRISEGFSTVSPCGKYRYVNIGRRGIQTIVRVPIPEEEQEAPYDLDKLVEEVLRHMQNIPPASKPEK